jgi:PIN like domain
MDGRVKKSKRSSAASSRRPRDAVTFFIDRSLGARLLAAALRSAGATVEVHDDHFPQDTVDTEWLSEVGRRRWVVLSKDVRIRRDREERSALLDAGVKAFFLTQQGLTGETMAEIFVCALAEMTRRAARSKRGFICTIARNGQITLVS